MKKILTTLFERHFCRLPDALNELPRSGSPRRYFRMSAGPNRCIGVYSPDPGETKAFIRFTRHFHSKGLHVPLLLAENRDLCIYLLEDLGDLSLNRYIEKEKTGGGFPAGAIPLYRLALEHLVDFQVEGHKGMDYTVCVPRQEFDRQSILWDLNHFKY